MVLKQGNADLRLLSGRHTDQADDSEMGSTPQHRQLAKVLIEGYQDPLLFECPGENFVIPWIFRPVATPDDVQSELRQGSSGSTPDTGIQKEFHLIHWGGLSAGSQK